MHDTTDILADYLNAWKGIDVDIDAVYSGFLGAPEQVDIIRGIYETYPGALRVVDPVMADHGKVYPTYTPELCDAMAQLAADADILTPNLTEAAFMLGEEYVGDDYDEAYVHALLKRLTGLGCKTAILTGISYQPGQIGAVAYDSVTDTYASYFNEKLPVRFHGTGDVFASACVGALMNGKDLAGALKIAVDYTLESIRETTKDPKANWYGVNFESAIPMLVHSLGR